MNKAIILLLSFSFYTYGKIKYVVEDASWYANKIQAVDAEYIELDNQSFIDIRAMGDTAWTNGARPSNGSSIPRVANFDEILNDLDPNKDLFVGDLNFLNWESVVGEYCDFIRPTVSFYFISHPDSIAQAASHGFNLFGLANNHSQDCNLGRSSEVTSNSIHGALMSAESMRQIEGKQNLAWHGVGESVWSPVRKKIISNNKEIDVLFMSVTLIGWDIPNTAFININNSYEDKIDKIIDGFKNEEEVLKVLSIHTQDSSGHMKNEKEAFLLMKRIGERFLIEADGDIVLGHGAHTYGGVRVFETSKKKSVFITSLGNFIHDGLRSNPDNYIARILLDPETNSLKQVQMIPFINNSSTTKVELYPYTDNKCQRNYSVLTNFNLTETSNKYSNCTYYSSF